MDTYPGNTKRLPSNRKGDQRSWDKRRTPCRRR